MNEEKQQELLDISTRATEPPRVKCPACDAEFMIDMAATFSEHDMTVVYQLDHGHHMGAAELGRALIGLDGMLSAVARKLGARVMVTVTGLQLDAGSIGATVRVVRVESKTEAA